ncbi:MAG: hypothetical protein BA868_00535 [Desulfobacterales bacterium C00003106]|jgi:hypothetical protein|nr:MAG: hypothetical protein BA868_00535 [Desulfobacterales bacterium C00003106]OEU59616.1 MAG: hypothetical protein BAW33_06970 [Desulfobacterales bacterium C00003104]
MSIRFVALELYRLRREVESLEREIETVPVAREQELLQKLRKLRNGDKMKNILEGKKERPAYRRR